MQSPVLSSAGPEAGRDLAERREFYGQCLPRRGHEAGKRVDRRSGIRIGRDLFAKGLDAVDDGAARGVTADVLRAGILRDENVDAAEVAQRKLQRTRLELSRHLRRLSRIAREDAARHV